MGILTSGITGDVTGRVGSVTTYMRNGQNIVRAAHTNNNPKATPARLAQREKIKVCNDFTRAFSGTGFFNKTFPAYGTGSTGYNRATGAIMNLAITGTYPGTRLDYKEVLVSKGPLPAPAGATAIADEAANIVFSWTDNSGNGTAKANDLVILVAYFPELRQAIFSIGSAQRADCDALLKTQVLKGFTAETWMGFLSSDEQNASNSGYCGRVELS
jgi:hypothetical protein